MNIAKATTEEVSVEINDEGVLASLGLNGQLFIFQLINFAIVAAIVWFLILRPLTKKMEERRKIIDASLDQAKEVEAQWQMSQKKYQEVIDDAKAETRKIITAAHGEAAGMADKMKIEAKEEIEGLVTQAKKHIQADREKMQAELKEEVVGMVIAGVERLLNEKLDEKKDRNIIEETLSQLKI